MKPWRLTAVLSLLFLTAGFGVVLGRAVGVRSNSSGPRAPENPEASGRAARERDQARARRDRLQEEVARLENAPEAPPKKDQDRPGSKKSTILLPLDESVRLTAEHRLEELEPRLELSTDQKPRVQAILERQMRPGIEQLYQGSHDRAVDENAELQARAELAQVLTSDQLLRYDRYCADSAADSLKAAVEQEAQYCSDALGLNAEQQSAIQAALERDPMLSRNPLEEGRPLGNLDAEMGLYRQRQVRFRSAVAPLLTGDQVLRFEEYLKEEENEYRQRMKLYLNFYSRGKTSSR